MFVRLCLEQPVVLFRYELTTLVCMERLQVENMEHLGVSKMEFLSNTEMMERFSPGTMACPFKVLHNVASAN